MHLKDKRIAVIGAGIGGLAAALAVARRGADVTVFEAAPVLREVGAGLQISANGLRVLEALGLEPLSGNAASFPRSVEILDYKQGKEIAAVPLNVSDNEPFAQVHRADLLRILQRACKQSGVSLRLGRKVEVDDPREARLTIPSSHTFAAIIAADGLRSETRLQHFSASKPVFTNQVAWRALVPAQQAPGFADLPGTRLYLGPKRHLVVYPLRDRSLINLVAIEERTTWTAEGWKQTDDARNLRQAFQGWNPQVTDLLSQVEAPLLWGLFTHPVLPTWVNGRTVLLGDAAHPMLPFMAQGACAALEDAWVLARALDREPNTETALQAYETLRKPRASRVQATSAGNTSIYHAAHPVLRAGLHFGMRVAARFAPALISNRFNWIYNHDVTRS